MNEERVKMLEDDIFDLMKNAEAARNDLYVKACHYNKEPEIIRTDYRPYMDVINIFIDNEKKYFKYCTYKSLEEIDKTRLMEIAKWMINEMKETHNLMKKEQKQEKDFKSFKCLNKIYLTLLNEIDYIENYLPIK